MATVMDPNQTAMELKMINHFHAWADVFFSPGKKRFNAFIPFRQAFDDFRANPEYQHITLLKFKRSLASWCAFKGYVLNPIECQNSEGRIIRKCNVSGRNVAAEMIFIKK